MSEDFLSYEAGVMKLSKYVLELIFRIFFAESMLPFVRYVSNYANLSPQKIYVGLDGIYLCCPVWYIAESMLPCVRYVSSYYASMYQMHQKVYVGRDKVYVGLDRIYVTLC